MNADKIIIDDPLARPKMSLHEFRALVLRYAPELAEKLDTMRLYPAILKMAKRAGFPRRFKGEELVEHTLHELWMHIEKVYLPSRVPNASSV